jgi:hypothetical protein
MAECQSRAFELGIGKVVNEQKCCHFEVIYFRYGELNPGLSGTLFDLRRKLKTEYPSH